MNGLLCITQWNCMNNGLLLWIMTVYVLHRMSSLLRLKICAESGVPFLARSIKSRDKAELNPLKTCYIAVAERFASFRKKGLQFITPYLSGLLKVQLSHLPLKVRPVMLKDKQVKRNQHKSNSDLAAFIKVGQYKLRCRTNISNEDTNAFCRGKAGQRRGT